MDESATKTCRICLQEMKETEQYHLINNDNELKLKSKLLGLLPKIDLNITPNPIICNRCMMTIEEILVFKRQCLQTETTVRNLQRQIPFNDTVTNIKIEIIKEELVDYDNKDNVFPAYIEEPTKTELYYCHNCDFNTNKKRNLIPHMKTHISVIPFVCCNCGFSTKHKWHLKRHMLTHSSNKAFVCETCGFATRHQKCLNAHMKTHSLVKPFLCETCGFSTRQNWHLKAHMLTHSSVKSFVCETCGFSTRHQRCLTRHMMIHSEIKQFVCEICGFSTRHQRCLNTHMMTHSAVKP